MPLVEVTEDEFYKAVKALKVDVHPHIRNRGFEHRGRGYIDDWIFTQSRELFGVSEDGDPPFTQARYFLNRAAEGGGS